MEEKTFKGRSIERSKEKTIKILFAVAFVWALHVSHTHALAGMAESVYRYEYSSGLELNIGAPSDMCPAEYGNQRCMWVETASYSSTSTIPYFRSPTFLSISDLATGYIAGQAYEDKQWILFNTKSDKTEFTFNSESGLKAKIVELGGSGTLYDLQHVKDHFKKIKEPFDFLSLIFVIILFVIFIGIPVGIIFGIYKIIKKIFYPAKSIPIAPVDITVNTTLPISMPTLDNTQAVTPTTATVPSSPTFTNNTDIFKKLGAIVFILVAFLYVGNTFMSSSGDFSFGSMFPKDKPLGGKALYKMITNQEVIKEKKSLTLLHEKEGLLKDNLSVYRCDPVFSKYQNCAVQDVVKHPETFVRISNIYGQDSTTVYILDGDTNRYKVFSKPEHKTFRSYFVENELNHGLYSWDDYQVFKGEKVIRGSASSTLGTSTPALKPNYNVFRSTFFKQYSDSEIVTARNPYQGMTLLDGNIQFASDGEFIYHGDGKSTAASDSIYVFKVDQADLATFQPYGQEMLGTSYLKYATDKSHVFCDNVRIDEEGYPVSEELSKFLDPSPKSFQVMYPTGAITERNAGIQVAKTDTQVFVNCTPYSHIDAASFKASTAPKVFTDKNNSYYLSVVASGTLQVATLSTTSPVAVTADRQDYQGAEVKESGYFIHKDSQGGFSIELPNNFYVKETPLNREDLIFSARSNKGSQTYPVAIAISVEKNAVSESDILRVPSSALEEGGFKVARDYSVAKGNKTIRLIESGILSGNGLNRVTALYVGSSKLYLVTSIVESTGWEENKDMMTRMVLSFKLD